MRRARKILRALRIYLLAKMWLIRPYMRGNYLLLDFFPLHLEHKTCKFE